MLIGSIIRHQTHNIAVQIAVVRGRELTIIVSGGVYIICISVAPELHLVTHIFKGDGSLGCIIVCPCAAIHAVLHRPLFRVGR